MRLILLERLLYRSCQRIVKCKRIIESLNRIFVQILDSLSWCSGVGWLGSVVVARVVLGGCLPLDLIDCRGVFLEWFDGASFADLVAALMNFHLLVSDDCGE